MNIHWEWRKGRIKGKILPAKWLKETQNGRRCSNSKNKRKKSSKKIKFRTKAKWTRMIWPTKKPQESCSSRPSRKTPIGFSMKGTSMYSWPPLQKMLFVMTLFTRRLWPFCWSRNCSDFCASSPIAWSSRKIYSGFPSGLNQ